MFLYKQCVAVTWLKVKLLPKSNQGFICGSIMWFSGKLIFNGVQGHFYGSIKISVFKTLRRLNTTWIFACSITRVSTHEHEHWEHCLCTQFTNKKVFGQLMLAVALLTCRHHCRQKVLIPECDLTGRRSTITLLLKSASFIVIMHLHKGLTHSITNKTLVSFWREFPFKRHHH